MSFIVNNPWNFNSKFTSFIEFMDTEVFGGTDTNI